MLIEMHVLYMRAKLIPYNRRKWRGRMGVWELGMEQGLNWTRVVRGWAPSHKLTLLPFSYTFPILTNSSIVFLVHNKWGQPLKISYNSMPVSTNHPSLIKSQFVWRKWDVELCVEGGALSAGQTELWSRPGRAAHGCFRFEGEQRSTCVWRALRWRRRRHWLPDVGGSWLEEEAHGRNLTQLAGSWSRRRASLWLLLSDPSVFHFNPVLFKQGLVLALDT